MSEWSRRIPFKVDVAGVIHIMGQSLYSRPEAAIRELIQNAHDAVMRRRAQDLRYKGRIHIRQNAAAGTLEFHDDGIGLDCDEAEKYLGTLGIGMTGLLKGVHPSAASKPAGDGAGLIGQFGIGLFSAFMLAERMIVESRRIDADQAIRWQAAVGEDIELSSLDRTEPGTSIRLVLKPAFAHLANSSDVIEAIVKDYADYIPIPIFVNDSAVRVNVIQTSWFDPTVDSDALTLELEAHFEESPLDVLPIRITRPAICGALYVTP